MGMSRSWIGSAQGEQLAVLPLNFRDALPEDHSAWAFMRFVDELDLSAFEVAYRVDGVGRPPYAPKSILALLFYCGSKHIRSSRAIAAACHDDIGARVIMDNMFPDRSVFDRFMTLHAVALKELLPQTLRLGQVEGLVDVTLVAGDGTKFVANAAMSATVDEATLCAQITDLQDQLQRALDAWTEDLTGPVDGETHASLFGDGSGEVGSGLLLPGRPVDARREQTVAWRRISGLRSMLSSRQVALTYLREHPGVAVTEWQDRLARDQARILRCEEGLQTAREDLARVAARRQAILDAGKKPHGKPTVPIEENIRVRRCHKARQTAIDRAAATAKERPASGRVNITDPHSRIMPGKHDGFDQRHNIQAMACKNQFILGITVHDSPNDKQAMVELFKTVRDNLDTAGITDPIRVALFDNGYASEANFTTPVPADLLLVAVEKECRQTGRRRDGTSTAARAWQDMADRLDEPANKALYKRRGAIIEPLFAQLFMCFGRGFTRRGKNVETEICLWAVTHNLLKIERQRRKTV